MLYKTALVFILRFVIVWHSPLKLCQYEANLRLNCSGYEFTDINIPHTGIICWITSHYCITNDRSEAPLSPKTSGTCAGYRAGLPTLSP